MARGRRAARQRQQQITKAVHPNFATMAEVSRETGGELRARAFPLMDAIQAATGDYGNGYGNGQFDAMPRDPRDDSAFGPMDPLRPEAIDPLNGIGRTDPRMWQYQVGWNLPGNGNREVPWQVLRAASQGVGIMRRCIEVRKKHVRSLRWNFGIAEDAIKDVHLADPRRGRLDVEREMRERLMPEIKRLREFWRKPWKSNDADMGQWINAVMEDYLVVDGVAIFPRKTYGGDIHDFELIDPSTIKLLLDSRGVRPSPPHPAFQQMLYGFPRGEWMASAEYDETGNVLVNNTLAESELFYRRENFRSFSPYGLSATEMALYDARLYLQRMKWMLAEYDDGSTPLTWLEVAPPADGAPMTLTQQRQWEKAYNAKVSGQTRERHRVKVLPNGWKASQMTSVDERYKPEYDLHLIKLLASYYGVPIAELGFTEPTGLGNAGWHEGQAEVSGRLGLRPDTAVVTDIINSLSRQFLNMPPELEGAFVDPAAANTAERETVIAGQRARGSITLNEERAELGQSLLDFDEADMYFMATPTGPVFIQGAYERAQQAAQASQLQAQAQVMGTAGKLEIEHKRLEDGAAAREEGRDFAREQFTAQQEAEVNKAAEITKYRNWNRKHREEVPLRPFEFKHVEPDDGFTELDGVGPWRVTYEGWEWQVYDDITKSAMSWLEWNLKHPTRPRDASGRWVKASSLVDAIKDQGKKREAHLLRDQSLDQKIVDLGMQDYGMREFRAHAQGLDLDTRGLRTKKDLVEAIYQHMDIDPETGATRKRARMPLAGQALDAPSTVQGMTKHEQEIRAVHRELESEHHVGYWVPLADLRERLPGMSRADQDAALKGMATKPGVHIIPWDNRKALRQRDHDAALRFGGDENHALRIERDSEPSRQAHHERTHPQVDLTPQERRHLDALRQGYPDEPGDKLFEAQVRTAKFNLARHRASALAEIEGVFFINEGHESEGLGLRRFEASVIRHDLADDPFMPRLRAALENDDHEAIHDALDRVAHEAGLERIGDDRWLGPDQLVTFDPKAHKPIGSRPQPGERAHLVRPGYYATVNGERGLVLKADVEPATPEELRQASELRGGVGPKAPSWRDTLTPRQRKIDADIRATYEKLKGRTDLPTNNLKVGNPEAGQPFVDLREALRESGNVFLADLREELMTRSGVSRNYSRREVDAVLIRMYEDPTVNVGRIHAQSILMQRDRDSALSVGGNESHYLKIGEPPPAPTRTPAPKMTARQREIELIALGDELRFATPGTEYHASLQARMDKLQDLTKASEPDPKAPVQQPEQPVEPPQPDARWPGWLLDALIAAAVTSMLIRALPGLDFADLLARFGEWSKAYRPGDPMPDVRQWITQTQPELARRLEEILRPGIQQAHVEGWLVGQRGAEALVEAVVRGDDPRTASGYDIDWGDWTPGHRSAAEALLEPGGLERLLYQSNVMIKSITNNRLDQVGRVLGEGLARGDTPQAIARTLREKMTDNPAWAHRIAVTETNRAMSYASVMTYRDAGMAYKGWMTALDQTVCVTCELNEWEAPGVPRVVPIDELFPSGDPWPPAHPYCRCAPIPVIRFPRTMTGITSEGLTP